MSRPISAESVFRAIAHPTRRRLLELLDKGESAACDLASNFRHAQPTLSNHLRILEMSGLVTHRRRGRNRMYRFLPDAIKPLRDWLARLPSLARDGTRMSKT